MLVLMFLCDQSYTSHGRDFLLGVTILNSSALSHTFGKAVLSAQELCSVVLIKALTMNECED